MSDHNVYAVEGRVGTISIRRPEKKNAMTFAMLEEFTRLVAEPGADARVSVLIITGTAGSSRASSACSRHFV